MLHIAAAVLINTTARGDIGNWHDLALCNQEITTMYHGDRRGGGLPRKQKHRSLQLDSIQKQQTNSIYRRVFIKVLANVMLNTAETS